MCISEKIESWRDKKGQAFGAYLFQISKNDAELQQLQLLTHFLDEYYESPSLQQRFYHVWFKYYQIEVCPFCGNPKKFSKIPKFSIDRYGLKPTNTVNYYATCMSDGCSKKYNLERTHETLIKKYGTKNIMQIPGAMNKMKETNNAKYGSDFFMGTEDFKNQVKITFDSKYNGHPTKLKETQDKKKKTNLERYGHEHSLNNSDIREKSRITNNLRYGGNSSMCSEETKKKSIETNKRKRGTDWYVQSDDFKKKFKETMLLRYGVEQVMHYTPSFEKSTDTSYRKKIYVFPSGRVEKIQGYEGFAINDLLDSGYLENDIIISNRDIEKFTGKIWYNDSENKRRKYYPDIYIISENKIIEVKSDYTYDSAYSINMRKRKSCLDLSLNFDFWIYDKKGDRIIK
jgi:hypothetical protein